MSLRELLGTFGGVGRLDAILLRPARETRPVSVDSTVAIAERGLEGDRSSNEIPNHRSYVYDQ